MFEILLLTGFFAFFAIVFATRYWIGKIFFFGAKYQRQGYQLLRTRRGDACLADTMALCLFLPLVLDWYFHGKAALSAMGPVAGGVLSGFLVLMFLWARLAGRICVFFSEEGLLLSGPFRRLRFVPWSEIESVRKRNHAELYDVLGQSGRRLTWLPLNRKTLPFFKLAQKNGISVHIPKGKTMVLDPLPTKRAPGEWGAVLARSAYAKNKAVSFAAFHDFIVVLFLDRKLNENNVIALNRDGTVRWRVSDIVCQPGPVSYAAMTKEGPSSIRVLAVTGRSYDGVLYTIDVDTQTITSQQSMDDCS